MGVDQVLDVNVVANGRAVARRKVGAEDGEWFAPSGRGVERAGDEMGLRSVIFADLSGCAGDIEVAKRRVARGHRPRRKTRRPARRRASRRRRD